MTPRQTWLLAAVKAGEIGLYDDKHYYHKKSGLKVTFAVAALARQGLVQLGKKEPTRWVMALSESGEKALEVSR